MQTIIPLNNHVFVSVTLNIASWGLTSRTIASGIAITESQLEAGRIAIANPSVISKAAKVTKQIINTLLAPAKSLAELLGLVSDIIPSTEPVAEIFRVSLQPIDIASNLIERNIGVDHTGFIEARA